MMDLKNKKEPRVHYVVDPSLEMAIRDLRETIQWRKSRPLIRIDRKFFLGLLITVDVVFKAFVIYSLWQS